MTAAATDSLVPLCGQISDGVHRLIVRVYHADTDFSGVVYNARYLEFLERGRTEFLRLADIHHHQLADAKEGERLMWVVRRLGIDFTAPARMDDVLAVETAVAAVSGARLHMRQRILHDGQKLVEAQVEAALVNHAGRPRRFPEGWAGRLRQ